MNSTTPRKRNNKKEKETSPSRVDRRPTKWTRRFGVHTLRRDQSESSFCECWVFLPGLLGFTGI